MNSAQQQAAPWVVIESGKGRGKVNLRELWAYRDLLFFLTWRDISVRYKQTILGAAWAVIQPLMSMVVFTIFFGRLANIPSEGVPYPIFSFAALLPWQYFSTAVTSSSNSLVGSANLLSKVYFPRLLIPFASVLPPVIDFAIAFVVFVILMFVYGVGLTWQIVCLPAFLLLSMAVALGTGLWFSALNVRYRDVRHVTPFILQFGMFVSPVVYPSSLLPEKWRLLYGLNPMAGAIEGFRWAVLGDYPLSGGMLALSVLVALSLLVTGLLYFRRTESTFADIV